MAKDSEDPKFRYPVGLDAEGFWRTDTQGCCSEELMRIARLDNETCAEIMAEIIGVDYFART